jgi:hypothetical protein
LGTRRGVGTGDGTNDTTVTCTFGMWGGRVVGIRETTVTATFGREGGFELTGPAGLGGRVGVAPPQAVSKIRSRIPR